MEMDFNAVFEVLGIEPTKDENLIRSAYRAALPANNPEDNPEGFKLLRKAYERAMHFSEAADEICADDMRLLVCSYIKRNEFDKAIAAITSKPSYEREIKGYHMLLSHIYKHKKNYEMSIKHGRLRLENIKEKIGQLETGEVLEKGNIKESLMHSLSDANLQLGLMFMTLSQYSEAVSFLEAAQNASFDNLAARINLAYCYFNLHENEKADKICDGLIKRLGEQNALTTLKKMIDNGKDLRK